MEKGKRFSVLHHLPAFLLDLDGALVDSVYQHTLAWRKALDWDGVNLPVWYIHRHIGMTGGWALTWKSALWWKTSSGISSRPNPREASA